MRYNGPHMINRRTILTQKQKETLDFIDKFITKTGSAPTMNELRTGLGLSSLRSVSQRLEALERKGFIKRDRFRHRGISLLPEYIDTTPSGTIQIPVIASAGADAMQVYAQEQYDEYLTIDKSMINPKKEIVAIRAIGSSMVDANIRSGDYVLVEVGGNVENCDRVIAILGDMAVIKKIQFTADAVVLYPEAKGGSYQPIVMPDDSKIFGRVLRTISMKNNDNQEITYDYKISN